MPPEDRGSHAAKWKGLYMLSNLVAPEQIPERGYSIDAVCTARLDGVNNIASFGHRSESVSRSELKFSLGENMADRIREAASLLMEPRHGRPIRHPEPRSVQEVEVDLVWLPPWTPERLTGQGRARLGVS